MKKIKKVSHENLTIDINIISPISVYLYGVGMILLIYLLAPLYYPYKGNILGFLYIILSFFSVFIGLIIGEGKFRLKPKIITFKISVKKLKLLFKVLILIAILGVSMRVYDKYILRGASVFQDLIANREAIATEQANVFSVLSSFIYPFSFILPFFYLLLKKYNLTTIKMLVFLSPVILFPVIDNIIFGSRSSLLVFGTLLIFYLQILGYLKIKFGVKIIIYILIFTSIVFILNGYMFSFRTELMGMDPINSTQISGYAQFAYLEDSVKSYLYTIKDSLLYFYILGLVNFSQYFIHGVFELLYLTDQFDTNNILYGQLDFFVFIKFFSKILPSLFVVTENGSFLVREGVYTTFFGPVYYDFGFFGLLFSLLFGVMTGFVSKNVQRDISLVPLYAFLLVITFFIPVVSLVVGAQGTYLIISFLLFYYISLSIKFDKSQKYYKNLKLKRERL